MNQNARFDSIQTRAVELSESGRVLIQVCNLPDAASQEERAVHFKARMLCGLAVSNAATALFTLRNERGTTIPPLDPDRDYNRFLERIAGIVAAEGLSCDAVADGVMTVAEDLLSSAQRASDTARKLLGIA